jgi:hypothetical protein
MSTNLQIDEDLKDEVQEIKDQAGNASLMSLSNTRHCRDEGFDQLLEKQGRRQFPKRQNHGGWAP